jgi:polar amino acid transport system ATP-binding protein
MMAATRSPMLDVRGLRKSFGGAEVLKGINLAVEPQELLFIIGPSGAGKSHVPALPQPPGADHGSIFIDGIDLLDRKTDINAMRRRIGMVFQAFNLCPHMTALGNVTLALRKVMRLANAQAETIGLAALARVGLKDKARTSSPEASSSLSPSPAPLHSSRRSCCLTSQPRRSTPSFSAACSR